MKEWLTLSGPTVALYVEYISKNFQRKSYIYNVHTVNISHMYVCIFKILYVSEVTTAKVSHF